MRTTEMRKMKWDKKKWEKKEWEKKKWEKRNEKKKEWDRGWLFLKQNNWELEAFHYLVVSCFVVLITGGNIVDVNLLQFIYIHAWY